MRLCLSRTQIRSPNQGSYIGERRANAQQTTRNFGLIDRAYDTDADYDPNHQKTQWQRFERKVSRLNRDSGREVQFKVLYLGRHGEGYHNVAEAFYGTPAWNVSRVFHTGSLMD
jgi:hypothetical protein